MPDGFDLAFAALGVRDRAALRELAGPRRFRRGDVLFHLGDDSTAAYVLREGRVKMSALTGDGREVVFGVAGPGALIGEIAAITRRPRMSTVRALEPVDSLALPGDALREALRSIPALTLLLLDLAAQRLAAADEQHLELAGVDVLGRVARRLLLLAGDVSAGEPGDLVLDAMLNQEELASWAAASREAVNRALGQLRGLGCIRSDAGRTILVDVDALRRYARRPA